MRRWEAVGAAQGDSVIGPRVEGGDPDHADTAFRAPSEGRAEIYGPFYGDLLSQRTLVHVATSLCSAQ